MDHVAVRPRRGERRCNILGGGGGGGGGGVGSVWGEVELFGDLRTPLIMHCLGISLILGCSFVCSLYIQLWTIP